MTDGEKILMAVVIILLVAIVAVSAGSFAGGPPTGAIVGTPQASPRFIGGGCGV